MNQRGEALAVICRNGSGEGGQQIGKGHPFGRYEPSQNSTDFLGIATAVAQYGEHPLPDPQSFDRTAGHDDLSGDFEAGVNGKGGLT